MFLQSDVTAISLAEIKTSDMSNFKDHFWAHIWGGLALAVIIWLVGVLAERFGHLHLFTSWLSWVFLITACLLTAGLTICLNAKINRRPIEQPVSNPLKPNFEPIDVDFIVLKKEVFYEYKNAEQTQLRYIKKVKVKALKHGLDCYRDKYLWTGGSNVKIKSGIKEQTFNPTIKKNVWQFYEIAFNRALNVGEEIETVLNFDLLDPENKAVPFFSATIEEPTDFLLLELTIPETSGVEEVACEESCSIGARKPYKTTTKRVINGKVKWEPPEPKLLHHYEMKWSFPT